jgi:hypothetical protein
LTCQWPRSCNGYTRPQRAVSAPLTRGPATGGQAIGALLGRVAGASQQLSAPGALENDQQRPAPQDEDPAGEVDGGRPWPLDHVGGRPAGPPSVVPADIRKFVIGKLYWWSQLPQIR